MSQPQARPRRVRPKSASFVLLVLIAVIYVISAVLSLPFGGGLTQPDFGVLVLLGAKVNELIAAGQFWRLITATFLHAGVAHIAFNGFALFSLGPEAERIYGTRRFVALYLISGLGGSVASYAFSPAPAVGASGAVFGLIGGLTAFYYFSRKTLGDFGRAQIQSMLAIVGINLVIGFLGQSYIDNWGHIGGLLSGVLVGAALAPRLVIDVYVFPPGLVRNYPRQGWLWSVALVLTLCSIVLTVRP
jgi:rhomboid protease GluP